MEDGYYYLLNEQQQDLPGPIFEAFVVDGDSLWRTFGGGVFLSHTWDEIKQLVDANLARPEKDALGPDDDKALLAQPIIVPTPAKKRPKLIDFVRDRDTDADTSFTNLALDVRDAFGAVDDSTNEMQAALRVLARRLGSPDDKDDGCVPVFMQLETLYDITTEIRGAMVQVQLGKRVDAEQTSLQAWAARLLASEAQMKQSSLSSLFALTTAKNAQASVNAFESTGVTRKVTGVVTGVATLKSDLNGVYDLVEKMLNSGFGGKLSGNSSPPSELQAFKLEMHEKLTTLKQRLLGSGPVLIGSWSFGGVEDCVASLKKWGVTGFVYEHIFDPVSIISMVKRTTVYTEDVNTGAILQLKMKKSPQMLAIAALYESMIPKLLSGAKAQQADLSSYCSVLNGIQTPSMWDRGDSETGVKNFIEKGLRTLLPQQAAQAETQLH